VHVPVELVERRVRQPGLVEVQGVDAASMLLPSSSLIISTL